MPTDVTNKKIKITLPDGSKRQLDRGVTGAEVASAIGRRLAKDALAIRVDGEIRDLTSAIIEDATVAILTFDDPDGINLFGYDHLEFYINGGAGSGQNPTIVIVDGMPNTTLSALGVIPQSDTWELVSIPISGEGSLKTILFTGTVNDTFYIDDMKLVAEEPPEPTAVAESEAAVLPSGYGLSQNYPNPFNPVTIISYDLPKASDVTLTVYNITGQQITTLVSKHQAAGHYQVAWDGAGFASGIYVYRLQAGPFEEARHMTLLK